jgi:putative tryptophan/tyrosine transport system substrate-binding protein
MRRTFHLMLVLLLPAGGAMAQSPVVLLESKVAQYREAANATKSVLPGAREVDLNDPDAASKLANAPVIVAVGMKCLSFARQRAEQTPVVFSMVLGVSRSWLTDTVTGVPLEPDPKSVLAHIRSVAPRVRRVGILYNPNTSDFFISEAQKAARNLGVSLVQRPIQNGGQVKEAVNSFASEIDAIWLPMDPNLFTKEMFVFLLNFSAERKLPLFAFLDNLTSAGALASVSADYSEIGEQAGRMAADVLKSGAGRRVPDAVFSPGKLTVNLRTAQALGIEVSAKALGDAKQVIK